ncbi:lysozyme [Citromicrobium bathyomarinum]
MNAPTQIILEHARAIVEVAERWEADQLIGHNGGPALDSAPLTIRVAQEIVEHEGIVLEAYLDSVGVWTWGIGVTNKSGHLVARYKDQPATIERCIEIYVWLLRNVYVPDVLAEFEGHELTEAQFAAALSFHWNTGAIRQASWCDAWKAGDANAARKRFLDWKKPAAIIPRRKAEAALFFDGIWSQDGKASVIPVSKPSYKPNFAKARQVDIREQLRSALT